MKEYWSPDVLQKLYWEEGLSLSEIAGKFGVSHGTIFLWMKKLSIPRRHRRPDIIKSLLEELYIKKKFSMHKIAKLLGTSEITIQKKIKKFDIKVRSHSETMTKYIKLPFSGSLSEKAYMIGLRTGDVSAKRTGKRIMVYTSTTHPAQVKMFKKTFGKYAHRIYSYIGSTPKDSPTWKLSYFLHESFDFLEKKPEKIPSWILTDEKLFYAFLAGYADCEGYWHIGRQHESKTIRLHFAIRSGDKLVLEEIKDKLSTLGFRARFYFARDAKKYGYKKDMYDAKIAWKEDVIKLAKILLVFSCHEEKIWKMKFILQEKDREWKSVKHKLEDFKRVVEKTRLTENYIRLPLPFHHYGETGEVL